MYQAAAGPSSIIPGQYGIITGGQAAMISPTWNAVQDPTSCSNSSGNFLVVNGENGGGTVPPPLSNSIPPSRIVWEQNFTVEDWTGYKFCFKAKNLDQCGFNITPKLEVQYSMPFGNHTETISITGGPCDWQEVSKHLDLWGYGTSLNIKIVLDQTQFGDGNDVAIDNIALIKLPQADDSYTFFSPRIPTSLGGNLYSIVFDANPLPGDCGCFWEVCELDPITDDCTTTTNTKVSNSSQWWSISTYCTAFDFAGYVGTNVLGSISNPGQFDITKTYRITRGAFCDCERWNQTSYDIFEKNSKIIFMDTKRKK